MSEISVAAQALRVLVIEDETLVLMNLEDMLAELGHSVAAAMMRLDQALGAEDAALSADVAILDVNLGGLPVFPLAERLAGLGIPLVFATGYGPDGLPDAWRDRPVLRKPYSLDEVERALAVAVAG